MFYNLKDRFKRSIFNYKSRDIYATPAARLTTDAKAVVLTQLQHKDLGMFLLACKSFVLKVPISHVYVLSDGTVTKNDFDTLSKHIPGVTFFELARFQSNVTPRGACWERLLAIAEVVKSKYVIQLDGDTLTLGDMTEINECINNNIAFTLGTSDGQAVGSMKEACEAAKLKKSIGNLHIQQLTELSFEKLPSYNGMRYTRGCAGFAGFPPGSFTREYVETLSHEVEKVVGRRWHEWGSEQVMSNIVVSNIPDSIVLSHPKHSSCEVPDSKERVFIHFIGYCRFRGPMYAAHASHVIRCLGTKN
jgi:hypothetical protein